MRKLSYLIYLLLSDFRLEKVSRFELSEIYYIRSNLILGFSVAVIISWGSVDNLGHDSSRFLAELFDLESSI